MRTTLRLASTAIAAALVLATSSVAAADELPSDPDPAASAGGEVAECEVATAGVGTGAGAQPAPDGQTDQTVAGESASDDPTVDDPCAEPAADPGDVPPAEPATEPAALPSPGASPEPADQQPDATTEPPDQQPEPVTPPADEPSGDPVGAPPDELPSDPGQGQSVGAADPAVDQPRELPAAPTPDHAAPTPDLAPPAPDLAPPAVTAHPPSLPAGAAPPPGVLDAARATLTPLAVLTTMPAGPSPLTVPFAGVDAFPAYDPQVFCDPTPKPGTEYLARLAISYFGAGRLSGISRDCSLGPTSEHKEGRAFDWALSVDVPREKAAGDAFVQWLTAVGPDGKVGYNARRLGVMYIIWDEQIWLNTDSNASWHAYWGPSPHTDHVHVSLTWAGAYEHTSWWTGDPIPDRTELARLAGRAWARVFGHEPDAALLTAWISRLADRGSLPVTGAELSRLAVVFAVVLDAGRWGLDHQTPDPGGGEWATTVGRPVI